MSNWKQERQDANRIGRWLVAWIVIVIVLAAVIAGGFWAFRVSTAPIKGQGDAAVQKYSAENWTAVQARFEENYQDIIATDQKIQLAADAANSSPNDQTKADTLQGLQSYCLSVVADYNADARKYLVADFRSSDLPNRIDTSDPATDCKETN